MALRGLKAHMPDKEKLSFLKRGDSVGVKPSCLVTFWQQPTGSVEVPVWSLSQLPALFALTKQWASVCLGISWGFSTVLEIVLNGRRLLSLSWLVPGELPEVGMIRVM